MISQAKVTNAPKRFENLLLKTNDTVISKMTNSYLHNAKGRSFFVSPVIVRLKILFVFLCSGSYFGPPQSNQNAPRGTDPLVIPGGVYAHSKNSRGCFWRCRCKCYHIALTAAKSTAAARAYGTQLPFECGSRLHGGFCSCYCL